MPGDFFDCFDMPLEGAVRVARKELGESGAREER